MYAVVNHREKYVFQGLYRIFRMQYAKIEQSVLVNGT